MFLLERICDTYEMENEISIGTDVTPVRWNNDGTIVLRCCNNGRGNKIIEKTFDIKAYINKI